MKNNTCKHEFDEPQCVYGCGTFITIEDGGYCPVCKDHSNNSVACLKCGEVIDCDEFGRPETDTRTKDEIVQSICNTLGV